MFSSKFCEISKNAFFTEHLWTTASEHKKQDKKQELTKSVNYQLFQYITRDHTFNLEP